MKYEVLYDWKDGQDICNMYRVKVEERLDYTRKVIVKDRSGGLYPDYYNEKVAKIRTDGNCDFTISLPNREDIVLNCNEVQAVLTGLLVEAQFYGYKISVFEKGE
jgi:hypothetical protein